MPSRLRANDSNPLNPNSRRQLNAPPFFVVSSIIFRFRAASAAWHGTRGCKSRRRGLRALVRRSCLVLCVIAATLWAIPIRPTPAPQASRTASPQTPADILAYIKKAWQTLGRSMNACSSIVDPKVTDSRAVLYLPQGVLMPPAVENLQNQCNVHVLRLPERITRLGDVKPSQLKADGLL